MKSYTLEKLLKSNKNSIHDKRNHGRGRTGKRTRPVFYLIFNNEKPKIDLLI